MLESLLLASGFTLGFLTCGLLSGNTRADLEEQVYYWRRQALERYTNHNKDT